MTTRLWGGRVGSAAPRKTNRAQYSTRRPQPECSAFSTLLDAATLAHDGDLAGARRVALLALLQLEEDAACH